MDTRRCTAFALAAVLLGGAAVEAATDEEKRAEAAQLLDDHFHAQEDREWVLDDDHDNDSYARYELTERYCGDITCWDVSLRVYPNKQSLDRILMYSSDGEDVFLGASQNISGWEYDLVAQEDIERLCFKFCDGYGFVNEEKVIIEHILDPWGTLRVAPDDTDQVDLDGSVGNLARWDVHKIMLPMVPELVIPPGATPAVRAALEQQHALLEEQAEVLFLFESVETGQYLRITSGGDVDARGSGGDWTVFKVHEDGDYVKLESTAFPGSYIAVDKDDRSVRVGTGGSWCRLKVFKN